MAENATQKALTKEDLIYILQTLFKIADEEDNVLKKTGNGLYVKDEHTAIKKELQDHESDDTIHITSTMRDILDKMTVDENDELLYDGNPITTVISKKSDNALIIDDNGGMYVKDYHADKHIEDEDIHVTKDKKDEWDAALDKSKAYTVDEISKIPFARTEIVMQLPTEDISSETLYFLITNEDNGKFGFVPYIYVLDKWWPFVIPQNKLEVLLQEDLHEHDNKDVIDLFGTDSNGTLLYNGKNIFNIAVKNDPTNAAKLLDNQELYVKDFTAELKSLETCAAFSKVNLYSQEISDSGRYQLKDDINNYNLLLIEYYYKPDKEGQPNGCAKTAVIDVDIINMLYDNAMDYMLEYGYGIMTSNSKIRMHEDKLWVDYYNNVCIYMITGIRKGDE